MPTATNEREVVRPNGAVRALFLAIAAGLYLSGSAAASSRLAGSAIARAVRSSRSGGRVARPPPPPQALPDKARCASPSEPVEPVTDQNFNHCKRPPAGKHVVPVSLKPDTDVTHLILWISSITCKSFVWSGALAVGNRRVTVVVPALVTREQAFQLFLDALNSVGLTVQPSDGFSQIIETARAKSKPIPLYDWHGHLLAGG